MRLIIGGYIFYHSLLNIFRTLPRFLNLFIYFRNYSIEEQKRVIELLRLELTRKEENIVSTEAKLQETKDNATKELTKVQEEGSRKFAELRKAFEHANKEKESAVIKYAMGEKDIIIARKGKEVADKKLLEANKDKEGLNYKIKTLSTERVRLQGLCDVRGQETVAAKREGEKWREECRMTETKLTNMTAKLNAEIESHKETKESLDTTLAQLAEVQGSVEGVKTEYLDLISKQKEKVIFSIESFFFTPLTIINGFFVKF